MSLYQFLLRRSALNAGAHLLPIVIDLYNWIHSQACYMVTLDVAKDTSTLKVLTSILQQHFPDQEERRLGQLHQIKGCTISLISKTLCLNAIDINRYHESL